MATLKTDAVITEYICTWCGKKVRQGRGEGRPMPGNCPRKPTDKNGNMKPHTWKVNKKYV